jgi:ribosomal-protein-alanine N-acetyltransferase
LTDKADQRIRTDRLVLRRMTEEDLQEWHRLVFSDPEVMRYLPSGVPVPMERTREVHGRWEDAWARRGLAPWGAELRATGGLIGHCGLRYVDEIPGEVEVLYALGRDHWGAGYATEAARASVRYGFERAGLDRILAFALPSNRASRRVMEKLGMTFERRARVFGIETVVYGLSRSDFSVGDETFEVE